MSGFWNRLTGEKLNFHTPEEAWTARLARMRKNVWLGVGMLKAQQDKAGGRLVMFTLTYARVDEWAPLHISACMRWLRRQNVRMHLWVAELQKRGAVHYHVLALMPKGQRWRKPNAKDGGWVHGYTWVTQGIKRPYYVMKYLQKGDPRESGHAFPKGLRLYAVATEAVRRAEYTDALAWRQSHLPAWAACDGKDPCIVLGSRRGRGGVGYGPAFEYSPYSRNHLPDLERVEWQMRREFGSGVE